MQEGEDGDDLLCIRGQLGLVDGGSQVLRGVERERDVLGDVQAASGEGVLPDERAEGLLGLGPVGVELIASATL